MIKKLMVSLLLVCTCMSNQTKAGLLPWVFGGCGVTVLSAQLCQWLTNKYSYETTGRIDLHQQAYEEIYTQRYPLAIYRGYAAAHDDNNFPVPARWVNNRSLWLCGLREINRIARIVKWCAVIGMGAAGSKILYSYWQKK